MPKREPTTILEGYAILESESVSRWILQLSQGSQVAAHQLWNRYGGALEKLARHRFGLALSAAFSEEDLAQSVFMALWQNAGAGRLDSVKNRDELWYLLIEMTRRRALARLEYNRAQRRGGALKTIHASEFADDSIDPLNQLSNSRDLSPEVLLILHEEHDRLMSLLRNDQLRAIAQYHLEGYSLEEIAARVHVSKRTVQRKVNLIFEKWEQELNA